MNKIDEIEKGALDAITPEVGWITQSGKAKMLSREKVNTHMKKNLARLINAILKKYGFTR